MPEMTPVPQDDPLMIAWKSFVNSERYACAYKQALALQHEDGRPVSGQYRESVVDGALWVAFCAGRESTGFKCGAISQSTAGGNSPADCNWPFCGCDDKAAKVIETLQECDWGPLADANSLLRSAASIAERNGLQTNWDAFLKRVKEYLSRSRPVLAAPGACPHTWGDGNKAWGCVLPNGHAGEHAEYAQQNAETEAEQQAKAGCR